MSLTFPLAKSLTFPISHALTRGGGAGDPDRWMFAFSRGRINSGTSYTVVSGSEYFLTKKIMSNKSSPQTHLLTNFSAWSSPENTTAPIETTVPANNIIIDKVFYQTPHETIQAEFSGSPGATLTPGSSVMIDPIAFTTPVDEGEDVIEWVICHAVAGTVLPGNFRPQFGRGERAWSGADVATVEAYMSTPLADSTAALSVSIGGVSPAQPGLFTSDFVFGKGWDGRPVVLAMTDSIAYGRQEVSISADADGAFGFLERMLFRSTGIGSIPVMNIGMPGAKAANEFGVNAMKRHNIVAAIKTLNGGSKWPMTRIVIGMGSNDVSATLSTWWNALSNIFTGCATNYAGVPVVPMTMLGRTSSTDRHTSLANQTISTNWGVGSNAETINQRIRDNHDGLHSGKYIDAWAAWSNPSSAWKWRIGTDYPYGEIVSANLTTTAGSTNFHGTVDIPLGQKVAFQTAAAAWTGRLPYSKSGPAPDITYLVTELAASTINVGQAIFEQVSEEGTHPHRGEHIRIAALLDDTIKAAALA